MADAIMNGGIILGPIMTLIISIICIHCMHVLARCAEYLMKHNRLSSRPDYSEVVEMSFGSSKSERWQSWSVFMKKSCNIFICITQLGFCCVYFLFVSESIQMVLHNYGIVIQSELLVTIVLVPIWLTTLVRKLKHIGTRL
jgi:solute carrier family 36 (proton-coupled amino acid transporter)